MNLAVRTESLRSFSWIKSYIYLVNHHQHTTQSQLHGPWLCYLRVQNSLWTRQNEGYVGCVLYLPTGGKYNIDWGLRICTFPPHLNYGGFCDKATQDFNPQPHCHRSTNAQIFVCKFAYISYYFISFKGQFINYRMGQQAWRGGQTAWTPLEGSTMFEPHLEEGQILFHILLDYLLVTVYFRIR